MNNIFRFHKVKGVMQGSRGKFHIHFIGEIIECHQIFGIGVLHRHTKAHILHSHFHQLFQRRISTVKPVLKPPDLIICLLQALNGNTDSNVWKFSAQIHNPVGKKAVGRYDNPVALLGKLPHNILQICPYKRLPTGDIGKVHGRKLFNHIERDFLLRKRRLFVAVTHITARIAAVCDDYGSV